MPNASTGDTGVSYGSVLRIGYRQVGSSAAFTYVPYYPGQNELPYTFTVPAAGTYEFELTQVCSTCASGNKYSTPIVTIVTIP